MVLPNLKKTEILQRGSPYGVENSQKVSGCRTGKQRRCEFLCPFPAVIIAYGNYEKSYLWTGASAANKFGVPELTIA